MQEAIKTICAEHRSISAVLSGLSSLAQMMRDASLKPEFSVLHAMIYYIDTFPDRLHHPKEDRYLFAVLAERDPSTKALVDSLKEEHVKGAALVRDLERALNELELTWPRGADRFADVVAAYARFEWDHMRREEHELLPLAEKCFTSEDWKETGAAFSGSNDDPIGDLGATDFEALYQRILKLAPAPVGLGDRWEREAPHPRGRPHTR